MSEKTIKWPLWMMLIRHDVSVYNELREKKQSLPLYQHFLAAWNRDKEAADTRALALEVYEKIALNMGDAKTPLAEAHGRRPFEVGQCLRRGGEVPDVIFVSPYDRTLATLEHLMRGWPELRKVKVFEEERIREQEHGLALLYNDWRIFETLHPEQRLLRRIEGVYWYRYPQGESMPDVRDRNRAWTNSVIRDFAGKRVLAVTHHLNILGIRANLERLSAKQFIEIDEHDKPINCGVTLYRCDPTQGTNGHLVLEYYNRRMYS